MRDEPNEKLKCQSICSCRTHKGCWFIETAGRCPWRSGSAKECVTTHLPNEVAPKMDGAQASVILILFHCHDNVVVSKKTWGFGVKACLCKQCWTRL